MIRRLSEMTYRGARRVVIAVVGASVLAIGIAMIVLPGPAFVVIPVGLAILATEFVWAKRLLRRLKATILAFRPGSNARPGALELPPKPHAERGAAGNAARGAAGLSDG